MAFNNSEERSEVMGKTPMRTIRISDELWTAALAVSNENGVTVSDVVRNALAAYVEKGNKK
jgi:antitoxin component of RelBE/YafQ-DinJ toxin-antitoxin module